MSACYALLWPDGRLTDLGTRAHGRRALGPDEAGCEWVEVEPGVYRAGLLGYDRANRCTRARQRVLVELTDGELALLALARPHDTTIRAEVTRRTARLDYEGRNP